MKRQNSGASVEEIADAIVAILTEAAPEQLKTNELSKKLGIRATDQQYDLVREALEGLEDRGTIFKGPRRKYGITIPNIAIEGRLEMNRRGRGVVIPIDATDATEDAIEVDGRSLWTAFNGDIVKVKITAPGGAARPPQGEITRVLKRASDTIVGTLKQGRELYVDPDDRRIHKTITIARSKSGGAKVGDKVVVRYTWDDPYDDPEGVIIKKLGRAGEMKAEIASIAAAHNLPLLFPDDVLAEADAFPDELTEDDLRDRRDLRDMAIFTIDPVDARDFDDAISIERHDDGDVTLGIHIADVSHYVQEGSALDREAFHRGTSVYLVTGVIPMLPERLSNHLCSLRPDEDKLTYSVFARLSPRGAIRSYEITKSVIRSKRRFTYEEALKVLDTGEGDFAEDLLAINKIVHCLRSNRRRKGSVDFESTELKFVLDENDFPIKVVQKRATESTRLIEDCMLLANRIVAEHIGGQRGNKDGRLAPFVYRIHDAPPKDKLLELAAFVRGLGYTLPVDNVQPKDIQKLIDSARGTDEEQLINEVTLRSMAKAVYSEFNIGHFGLAFNFYTHFTSPIRRYPDLIVHRMLHEYFRGMSNEKRITYQQTLNGITTHCSLRERAATDAERDSVKIAEVQFLKAHVGGVFEGVISSVAPFGLFVELKVFGIDGLVGMRSLEDDFYTFEERTRSIRGRRTRRVFSIGDRVFVRVIRVNEIEAQIDLQLIGEREFIEEGGESFEDEPAEAPQGDDALEQDEAPKRTPRRGTSPQKRAPSTRPKRREKGSVSTEKRERAASSEGGRRSASAGSRGRGSKGAKGGPKGSSKGSSKGRKGGRRS